MLKHLLVLWIAVCAPFALCYIAEAVALRWLRRTPAEPRANPLGRSPVVLAWPPHHRPLLARTLRAARSVC